VEEHGDDAPIAWVTRDARFVEKLATPDVTVADIIGDVDPIKAARGGHILSDELTIHYGLLPRANRGIFAVNELPDLAGKIQVGLFNIMQEGDVQIKGYPIRLALDVLLVFTANPEDYTARGKIITPLKDRIGAEIATHYPETVNEGVAITLQEAWTRARRWAPSWTCRTSSRRPSSASRSWRARQARRPALRRQPAHAHHRARERGLERRAARADQRRGRRPCRASRTSTPRCPSITGKLELEYEGELVGRGSASPAS
jgi:magnesium chelatase subunit I